MKISLETEATWKLDFFILFSPRECMFITTKQNKNKKIHSEIEILVRVETFLQY